MRKFLITITLSIIVGIITYYLTGVGKLEICDYLGLNCDDIELLSYDYDYLGDRFTLKGYSWYRQDNK